MRLLLKSLKDRLDELHKNKIKLTCSGDIESLPIQVQKQLFEDIERTKNNKRMTLNLALSYSGRWELLEAIRNVASKTSLGELKPEDISEKTISDSLHTKNIPDPDLVIRTSGEFRVSNFLLWQIAYSEFVITDIYWPDFSKHHLYKAIENFQRRERRFGKVSEQLKNITEGKKNVHTIPVEIA
jgi:undecaprenyl diphosphate synthase